MIKNTTAVELQWESPTLGPNISCSVSWVSASDETDRGSQAANVSGVTVTGLTPGTSYTIIIYLFLQQEGYHTARNTSTTVNIVTYPAQPGPVNTTTSKLDKPPYIIRFQPSKGRVDNYAFSFESKLQIPKITVISTEVVRSDLQVHTQYKYSIKAINSVGDESGEVEGSFKTAKSVDCNRVLMASSGTIMSPGYPSSPATVHCTWTIQGSTGTIIALNITDMEMGENDSWNRNYIEIFDGASLTNRTFGKMYTSWQTLRLSTTNYMFVVFKSSGIGRFMATYKSLQTNITLSERKGFISSPGYPLGYPNNIFYTWTIQGDSDTYIVINMTDIRLESGSNCNYDYLKIYDGPTFTSPLLGRFCFLPSTGIMISTSNYMFLEFKTDTWNSLSGFYGNYEIREIYEKKACTDNKQCKSNLQCLNATCSCNKDYYFRQIDAMCTAESGFNETCTEIQKCKYSLMCLNSMCSCDKDYYYSTDDAMCIPADKLIAKNKNTTGVELQWTATTFGSNISYSVSWVSASGETDRGTQTANERGVTLTGLTPGTSYTIMVYTFLRPQGLYPARNISTTVNVVTYPAQPGLVNTTASKLDKPPYIIRFQPSEGRIENYTISFKSKLHLLNKTVATHVVELSDLQADTEYNYSIKAINSVGDESSEAEGGFKTANSEVEISIGLITGATMGSLVAVVLLVVFIIISHGKIVGWIGEAKQKTRNREEQVDSRNENEEAYDSLDETINQMCVDVDHYVRYNVIRGLNPDYGLVNSPALPPRPQNGQYVDLGLVPINNTEHSLNDISKHLMNTCSTSDLQEDTAEESDHTDKKKMRLIDTFNIDCTDEFESSDLKIDPVNLTELKKNPDEISSETEPTLTVEPYDSLMLRAARTEENSYFPFTNDLQKKTSVHNDVISTDKDVYLTPTKPAKTDNKKNEIDVQNEIKTMQNDLLLSLINPSLDGEGHTLDSSEQKYIHISSFQGSPSLPVMTDQIDDKDKQSYIYPIDPDDLCLPISYGYHTWDGAEDASNQDTTDTEV